MYVKSLGQKAVCRFEESKEANIALSCFNEIFRPNHTMEVQIEVLSQKIQDIALKLAPQKCQIIPFLPFIF